MNEEVTTTTNGQVAENSQKKESFLDKTLFGGKVSVKQLLIGAGCVAGGVVTGVVGYKFIAGRK